MIKGRYVVFILLLNTFTSVLTLFGQAGDSRLISWEKIQDTGCEYTLQGYNDLQTHRISEEVSTQNNLPNGTPEHIMNHLDSGAEFNRREGNSLMNGQHVGND